MLDDVAYKVCLRHAIESIEVEQRRVSGAPTVTVRCQCGKALDMGSEFAEHVAEAAVDEARTRLEAEGLL